MEIAACVLQSTKKMFSSLNTEDNVIKNMAKEIVRDSALAGVTISVDLAIYLIHLKFLIPHYGYKENKTMDRNFTQPIIEECVQDFIEDSIWINTLKLQSFCETNKINRDIIKENYEASVSKRWRPLMKEIIEMDTPDKDTRDKLFRKIILFTVVYSGLGNPTVNTVLREAQAALQSVFRHSDLDRFTSSSDAVKEEQLLEFSKIVNGIRLFNKDCQKGGDGIDDLPLMLTQASQMRKEKINNVVEQLMKRFIKITYAFDKIFYLSRRTQVFDGSMKPNILSEFRSSDLEEMKKILCMIREREYYMRKLLINAEESTTSIVHLIERFRETLLQLHDVVRYRSAVPTIQVYPLFIILSGIWLDMQKEAAILSEINSFASYLQSFSKYEEQTPFEANLSSDIPLEKEDEIGLLTLEKIDRNQLQNGVSVISDTNKKLANEPQFGGYCAFTLAVTGGLLMPGNPAIGFLSYKNRIYSFSSFHVALEWGRNPDSYLVSVYQATRANLELVKILNLYDELYKIKTETFAETETEEIILKNVEMQTEIHPVSYYRDPDYTFSLWEYKRRALQLSHIINYQTKSQQTVNHTHYRASIGLQTNPDKDAETQTKQDNSCNHPIILNYLMGLRGHYEDKFQVLDLTRPVDEEIKPEDLFKESGC